MSYIFIFIRPKTTKFGLQVHLENLTQMRLMKHMLVTPSRQNHMTFERCYNFLSARAMIIKFGQNNYEETPIKFRLT